MKYYLILWLMFSSLLQGEERVILFEYFDANENKFEYYSNKEKLKTLKDVSRDNLGGMITFNQALLAVESSVEYKKERLTRKQLESIELSFLGLVKVNGKKQIIYMITYTDAKGLYKSFYVLSNGVVLEKSNRGQ